MIAAARLKRMARYTMTETSASASLMITNVAPQMSAQKANAKSARSRLLNMCACSNSRVRVYAGRGAAARRATVSNSVGP